MRDRARSWSMQSTPSETPSSSKLSERCETRRSALPSVGELHQRPTTVLRAEPSMPLTRLELDAPVRAAHDAHARAADAVAGGVEGAGLDRAEGVGERQQRAPTRARAAGGAQAEGRGDARATWRARMRRRV